MVPDSAIPVHMCPLPVGTYGVVSGVASGLTPFNALCEEVRRPLFSGPTLFVCKFEKLGLRERIWGTGLCVLGAHLGVQDETSHQ